MMPRTLACFGLALLVLLAALVLPSPQSQVREHVPLDMTGIREVEVRSTGIARITLSAADAPGYRLPDDQHAVRLRREGERLVVESEAGGYGALELVLPPTVATLVVPGARIEAGTRPERLEVHTTGNVYWNGDAGELLLHDLRVPQPPGPRQHARAADEEHRCLGDCLRLIEVEWGRIDRLEVRLQRSGVAINRPDRIGEVRLHLGPEAWFSLGHARGFANLQVINEPDAGTPGIAEGSTE